MGSKNPFCKSPIDRVRAGSEIGLNMVDGLRCVIMRDGRRFNLEVQGYRGLESAWAHIKLHMTLRILDLILCDGAGWNYGG
jgi:hypothetical protein